MSNKTAMVVAKQVELLQSKSLKEGTFDPVGAHKVTRERVIVQRVYAERINNPNTTGKVHYIIDEEASLQLEIDRSENAAKNAENAKLENATTADLIKALLGGNNNTPKDEKSELEKLRERADELELDYDKRMGVAKLKSLIEKAEQDEQN